MTLMTIKDFRARPCCVEYITLYICCSCLLITLAAASFGQLEASWGIANAVLIGFSAAFLGSCRIKRHARATQFYTEWLRSLSRLECAELIHRFKANSKERRLVINLHFQIDEKKPTNGLMGVQIRLFQ